MTPRATRGRVTRVDDILDVLARPFGGRDEPEFVAYASSLLNRRALQRDKDEAEILRPVRPRLLQLQQRQQELVAAANSLGILLDCNGTQAMTDGTTARSRPASRSIPRNA